MTVRDDGVIELCETDTWDRTRQSFPHTQWLKKKSNKEIAGGRRHFFPPLLSTLSPAPSETRAEWLQGKVRWDSITWDTKHLIIVHLIILIYYPTGTVVVNRIVSDEFRAFYTDMLEFTYWLGCQVIVVQRLSIIIILTNLKQNDC